MSQNSLLEYYVERASAEQLQAKFGEALKQYQTSHLVFHINGVGGVGKTTLTAKLKEKYQEEVDFIDVSFGLTANIETPIKLMENFHQQLKNLPQTSIWRTDINDLSSKDFFPKDYFEDLYQKYKDGINQLQTQTIDGKKGVDKEQLNLVKSLVSQGTKFAAKNIFPVSSLTEPIAEKGGETLVNIASAVLSEKDRIEQLVRQHSVTKKNKALQELLLNPIPKLTEALVQTLSQRKQPLVLIFDTYEKVIPDIDAWLWQDLIANTDLKQSPVRIIIAGRKNILKSEPWRKLNQDQNCIYDISLNRFNEQQTQAYLQSIGIEENELITQIFQATKGLPYYLNKIRERRERGQEIDYSQLNEDIVRLLLQGINDTQKLVIELASCSRWFGKSLIKFLIDKHEELEFKTGVDKNLDCFAWLKQLDFVEYVQGFYRLDDVARDVFRESLYREDKNLFEQTHQHLASYFKKLADDEANEYNPSEQYDNSAWRQVISEYLYHSLYGNYDNCQVELISYLFTSRYFEQDEIVQIPIAIIFEENHHELFLKQKNHQFIQKILPVLFFGEFLLGVDEIYYGLLSIFNFTKPQIDSGLNDCFGYLNKQTGLTGLAQFLGLFYKSKRSHKTKKLDLLNQAYKKAIEITSDYDSEFSSSIFFWLLGNEFYTLEKYEEAIASYDKALSIKPDNDQAWNNRGIALGQLGRNEETIASYDKAIEINPDLLHAWDGRRIALMQLGRNEEAIASYDKALEFNPDYGGTFYNKACCYGLQNQLDLALENLEKAIKLDSQYREMAKNDTDFDNIRHDSCFQNLLA